MHFSRQIGAFVRAGIPIVDALQTVREGTTNERFRDILQDIAEQIQTGIPFSEALARHADVFPTYYIGILRSAEITGQLDVVLDQLSLYLERDLESRQKVKSALTYPAIVLVMSIVTVVILVGFVLPRFTSFFKEFDAKLPLPTQLLLDFSDFIQTWWWAIIGGGFLIFGSIYLFLRTEQGSAHQGPDLPAVAGDRRHRAVRRHRALLPDHLGDDEGRCAAAGGDAGRDRGREQQGLRARPHEGARRDARG